MSDAGFTVHLCEAEDGGSRAARRIIVNADRLKALKLCSGDVVALCSADHGTAKKAFSIGVLWPSMELSQNTIAISSSLLLTACLTEGNQVQIAPLPGKTLNRTSLFLPSLHDAREARHVRLREISRSTSAEKPAQPSSENRKVAKPRDWLTLLLREHLIGLKFFLQTQLVEVQYEGRPRRFCIDSVSTYSSGSLESVNSIAEDVGSLSIDSPLSLWIAGWETSVAILDTNDDDEHKHERDIESLPRTTTSDAYATVGGLDKTIEEIRDLIEIPLTRPELFVHFGLKPPRGILLHGAPGTGKTHLARAIAASTKSSVIIINGPELSSAYHGETESRLREVFKEARSKSPCVVVLDEIDALAPRRDEGAGGEVEKRVVATLLTLLDGMEDESSGGNMQRVVVIGTTNRPNAIDPALRRPGRFDREFEIGVPNAEARFAILAVLLSKFPHSIPHADLRALAKRAHGYVGADLSAVVREAGTNAIKRWMRTDNAGLPSSLTLTLSDLSSALPNVRPSALRSVFFETPPIKYSDIGGQAGTVQKLREAVEWPLLHPEAFERLGVRPPKGLLLYGPPGCSKTVLARACATESGVNFVAVKGPELLNKYVGESEKAVRETFRKARTASPAIIFFDEIDALGTSRTANSEGANGPSHEGVLTSLLNEMDGVQELVGVTILAATNRPEVIDSALMRPGRLDRILYVGPPDQEGREEILRIRTKKMSVDPGLNVEQIASMTEGCSGAEIAALCQEAALLTMKSDMNAPYVSQNAFETAAKAMRKQITLEVVQKYWDWSARSGLQTSIQLDAFKTLPLTIVIPGLDVHGEGQLDFRHCKATSSGRFIPRGVWWRMSPQCGNPFDRQSFVSKELEPILSSARHITPSGSCVLIDFLYSQPPPLPSIFTLSMRTNIELALNDLIVSNKDITIANAIPAYLRTAGFTEINHDALNSFEHAMEKYPARSNRSRIISGKQVRELMTEYWTGKLGTMCTLACPCSGCGKRVFIDPKILEQLQHPERKRRLKSRKTRRIRPICDVTVAVPVDPLAPSTSAVVL